MKKIISIILAMIIVVGCMSVAFAEESDNNAIAIAAEHIETNYDFFGNYSYFNEIVDYTSKLMDGKDIFSITYNVFYAATTTFIQFGVLVPAAIFIIFISIPTRAIGSLING